MNAERLASLVCAELVQEVAAWGDLRYVITRFQYPDGDAIPVYPEPDGTLSDRGTTLFKLGMCGLEITPGRQETIEAICAQYGVALNDNVLSVIGNDPSADMLNLCKTVLKVSTLVYEHRLA